MPPTGTHFLKENSSLYNEKQYLKTHGTAIGTSKMDLAFANIFMTKLE